MQATESSHISLDAVDMRKGFDGLYGLARDHLRQNPQSGVAAILSVVESCRRIGAPVKEYLAGVLPGLDRRTLSEVTSLTPARWNAARGRCQPGFVRRLPWTS